MSTALLLTASLLGTHGCAGHGAYHASYSSYYSGPARVVHYGYAGPARVVRYGRYGYAGPVRIIRYRHPAASSYAPSAHGPAYRPEAGRHAGTSVVQMTDRARFEPAQVTINVGETVEWRNVSRHPHTVTADPERAADAAHIVLPEGAEPFHSGEIPPGERFSHTFNAPGTYYYVCLPHEDRGMVGIVVVKEPDDAARERRGGGAAAGRTGGGY